jgi:hypothetical protein
VRGEGEGEKSGESWLGEDVKEVIILDKQQSIFYLKIHILT